MLLEDRQTPGRFVGWSPTYPAMAKFASLTVVFFNSGLDPVQYTCGGTLYPSKNRKTAKKVDLRRGRASCASATPELATCNKETSLAARLLVLRLVYPVVPIWAASHPIWRPIIALRSIASRHGTLGPRRCRGTWIGQFFSYTGTRHESKTR